MFSIIESIQHYPFFVIFIIIIIINLELVLYNCPCCQIILKQVIKLMTKKTLHKNEPQKKEKS